MPVHAMMTVLDVQAQSATINDDERVMPALPSTSHVCVASRSFNPRAPRQRSEVLDVLYSQFKPTFSLLSSLFSILFILSPFNTVSSIQTIFSLFSVIACTASLTFWLEQQSGTLLITFSAAHGGTVLRYQIRRQARALLIYVNRTNTAYIRALTCSSAQTHCTLMIQSHFQNTSSQSELKGGPEAAGRP